MSGGSVTLHLRGCDTTSTGASRTLVLPVFVLAPCCHKLPICCLSVFETIHIWGQRSLSPPPLPLPCGRFHSAVTRYSSCFHAKVDLLCMKQARDGPTMTSSRLSGHLRFIVSPSLRIRRCSRRLCKCCRTARPKLTSFACRSAKLCRPPSTTMTHRVSVTQWLNAKCAHCHVMLLACNTRPAPLLFLRTASLAATTSFELTAQIVVLLLSCVVYWAVGFQ